MGFKKWKVLSLAGALALGYAVSSQAAEIKVSDETFGEIGVNLKVWYLKADELEKKGDWSKNEFYVGNMRFYTKGQITKLVQFYGEIDSGTNRNAELSEAGVNLAFAPEFQIRAGQIRVPFSRYQVTSDYAQIIPSGVGWTGSSFIDSTLDPQGLSDYFPLVPQNPYAFSPKNDGKADAGVVIHGSLEKGMFRYALGLFNEDRIGKDKKNFEYSIRLEFTPTMLGFKPEGDSITGRVKDTYLGTKDVLTIGLGYNSEKIGDKGGTIKINGVSFTLPKGLTRKSWTVDALVEKKYGLWVPNLQLGYIGMNDSHLYWKGSIKKGDTDAWYVQAQLLYDQMVGFGKPALALRYDNVKADDSYDGKDDTKVRRWGVVLNYYLKGQAARVSLGFDNVSYKDAAKAFLKDEGLEDKLTNWYLYFQTKF
ncbi:MAG: porin [Thermodesulfobacteriaceae bacterium]|nr:porin [Thermodesulfobacteriaceae bacterium]